MEEKNLCMIVFVFKKETKNKANKKDTKRTKQNLKMCYNIINQSLI